MTDTENPTAEVRAVETVAGDLLSAMIDEMKHAPDVWQKMSEAKQQDVINRLRNRVRENVRAAVHLIASDDRPTISAKVDKVEFKDEVKATLVMSRHNAARHDLADATGDFVLLVVAGDEQYQGGTEDVKPDPDQQSIPDKAT